MLNPEARLGYSHLASGLTRLKLKLSYNPNGDPDTFPQIGNLMSDSYLLHFFLYPTFQPWCSFVKHIKHLLQGLYFANPEGMLLLPDMNMVHSFTLFNIPHSGLFWYPMQKWNLPNVPVSLVLFSFLLMNHLCIPFILLSYTKLSH